MLSVTIIVLSILLYLTHNTEAKIFRLNDTEYRKMPALYELDEYQDCLVEPGGTYCILELELFAEGESDLMKMIHGYSEVSTKHFNHTILHRGVCVTKTCKSFIGQRDLYYEDDLSRVLEACVNDTIWKDYSIQARVANLKTCNRDSDTVTFDRSDYAMVGVLLALIVLNSIGTFYDIFKKDTKGNPYLMAFSVFRNWKKLVAPSGEGPDPRLARLKLFNGLRTMTTVCVIFSHISLLLVFTFIKNPLYVERAFDDVLKQFLFNGSLVVCTFFVMSGFMLALNFELDAEKHGVRWLAFPRGLLLRWLRLTPMYALILGLVATLMRHLGSGPLWADVVTVESDGCRQYWWAHLFYINNYIYDDGVCMPQTWYLAADTQLFAVGLIFCVAVRTPRARKVAFCLMMLVSLLAPALHTYFQDLDGSVIQAPETMKVLYKNDDTFRYVYIRGHTNLASYTLGIAGGLLTYQWLTEGKQHEHLKKFRYLVWLTFPIDVLVILSGAMFYGDERSPLALRVAYAALYKAVFQVVVVFFIIACIFKAENVYRKIVEWRGFTWTGRVSYSMFLVHSLLQRGLIGTFITPPYMTDYLVFFYLCASLFLSFLIAGVMWICVENPIKEFIKTVMAPRHVVHNTKI